MLLPLNAEIACHATRHMLACALSAESSAQVKLLTLFSSVVLFVHCCCCIFWRVKVPQPAARADLCRPPEMAAWTRQ